MCMFKYIPIIVVVQLLSHAWLFVTLWTKACQALLSFTISRRLLKFMSIESVMLSDHLILCCPLLLLPSICPNPGVFSIELAPLPQVAKVLKLQLQQQSFWWIIQDWLPLGLTGLVSLLSKGLSRVFLQHHNLKASILRPSAFFMVQLSHSYMASGKTIALTIQAFVVKTMSLPFLRLCLALS